MKITPGLVITGVTKTSSPWEMPGAEQVVIVVVLAVTAPNVTVQLPNIALVITVPSPIETEVLEALKRWEVADGTTSLVVEAMELDVSTSKIRAPAAFFTENPITLLELG